MRSSQTSLFYHSGVNRRGVSHITANIGSPIGLSSRDIYRQLHAECPSSVDGRVLWCLHGRSTIDAIGAQAVGVSLSILAATIDCICRNK